MNTILKLIIIALAFCACDKGNVHLNADYEKYMELYMGFSAPDLDASIALTNHQSNFGLRPEDKVSYLTLLAIEGEPIANNNELLIDGQSYELAEGRQIFKEGIDRYYGKTINLSIKNKSSNHDLFNKDIYIPAPLDVQLDALNLKEGSLIEWNADEGNTEGVCIIVMYSFFENRAKEDAGRVKKEAYKFVEDNGRYVFRKDDFPNIPDDSVLFVKLLRATRFMAEYQTGERFKMTARSESGGYVKLHAE